MTMNRYPSLYGEVRCRIVERLADGRAVIETPSFERLTVLMSELRRPIPHHIPGFRVPAMSDAHPDDLVTRIWEAIRNAPACPRMAEFGFDIGSCGGVSADCRDCLRLVAEKVAAAIRAGETSE